MLVIRDVKINNNGTELGILLTFALHNKSLCVLFVIHRSHLVGDEAALECRIQRVRTRYVEYLRLHHEYSVYSYYHSQSHCLYEGKQAPDISFCLKLKLNIDYHN